MKYFKDGQKPNAQMLKH